MTCRDIEDKLPAYLEGDSLSQEEERLVEDHLNTCGQCSSALEDLKKTVNLLKGLPEVDTPPGFTRKIMAQIQEEAEQKHGILKKLFYPFHIKIPIEACATLLVGLLGLYIYQSTQPETGTISLEPQARIEQTIPKTVPPQESIKADDSSVGKLKSDYETRPSTEYSKKPSAIPDTPFEAHMSKEKKRQDVSDQERIQPEVTVPPAPLARQKEALSSAGGAQPSRSPVPDAQEQVSVQVFDIKIALGEIEQILNTLDVQTLSRKSYEGKVYLDLQIQPERVMELLRRLRAVGIVKENMSTQKFRESNVIKIEVSESSATR